METIKNIKIVKFEGYGRYLETKRIINHKILK